VFRKNRFSCIALSTELLYAFHLEEHMETRKELQTQLIALLDTYEEAGKLRAHWRETLILYFGLDGPFLRFDAVGKTLHLSPQRARQILTRAMYTLRKEPQFVALMNNYLALAPHPAKIPGTSWLASDGTIRISSL